VREKEMTKYLIQVVTSGMLLGLAGCNWSNAGWAVLDGVYSGISDVTSTVVSDILERLLGLSTG
jgi:hypothetical protein